MATNGILPFAQDSGALVQSQTAYAADTQRGVGHQPGVARPDFANKQARQAAVMVAGLAQFLADNQGTNIDDTLLSAALSTIITNAIRSVTAAPAGTIILVPGTSALPGTLKLNGALLTRVAYPRLWTYAQSSGNMALSDGAWAAATGMFSPGDGSTTFRIPDSRGFFIRMWDDARGVDANRALGSWQDSMNLAHTHPVSDSGHQHAGTTTVAGAHVHGQRTARVGAGPVDNSQGAIHAGDGIAPNWYMEAAGDHQHGFTTSLAAANVGVQSSGGIEVRVKNIAWLPLIYY